nr:hypothetical protein [Tanacetum cinerariifolium]
MDIRDEIKLSKAVLVLDSDQNKHRNKLPGVKPINRVHSIKSKLKDIRKSNSPIKSKLNDTGKSNSPKSRWVPMSERVSKVSDEPVVTAVESVVKESVKVPSKVTSKVSDESVKESVMVPVVKKSVKASSVGTDKLSSENQDKIDLVANKRSSLVAEKIDVVKDKVDMVADKASDALKNKLTGKGKKAVVGKDKDKPKNIASDVVKEKIKPNPKQKKKKLKGKLKKDVSNSELDTDVVDYSSDKADRKRKKLKIKAGLKRKRSGSDSSDSSDIDSKSIKLLISKLEKKVKKQESDEDSVPKKFKKKLSKKVEKEVSDEESLPKKGNKKLTKKVKKEESDEDSIPKKGKKKEKQLTPKEPAHEEYLSSFRSFHARTTPSSLFSAIKNSRVDILRFLTDIGFSVPLGGYSLFDLDERETDHEFVRKWAEIDFLFKVNFLTLFTNTMGKADGLKGQICLDVVRRLREDFVISDIDWCGYIYDCLRDNSISFEDDGDGDNVGDDDDENGDDDENMDDDDGGNVNNDVNGDSEDVNEGDKDPNGSNPSFGFSKISLEDFGNDCGLAEKDKAIEENTTEQGTVVEGNEAEEG